MYNRGDQPVNGDGGKPKRMDRSKVEELYREYGGPVYRRCLRMLGSEEEAETAVQEVFLRFMRRLSKIDDVEKASNYLFRVSTNYCLTRIRDRGRAPGFSELREDATDGLILEDQVAASRAVKECLDRLTGRKRMVVYLYFAEGMTQDEVARACELSLRQVGRIIRRFLAENPVE